MQIKEYVNNIGFKVIAPNDTGIILNTINSPSIVDANITILPEYDAELKELFKPLFRIPRMSTFALGAIINKCVKDLNHDQCFVNVGVWHGFTLLSGMLGNLDKTCIGIDNFSEFDGPKNAFMDRFNTHRSQKNHGFYEMDYEEYFKDIHIGSIGFYIYDGNHSRENQHKGLAIAERFFSEECIIFIDDANNQEVIDGTNDFLKQSKYKYEQILACKTAHNMHPTLWNGVIIFKRRSDDTKI